MKNIFLSAALGLSTVVLCVSCGDNSAKTENTVVDTVKTAPANIPQPTAGSNEFAKKATIGNIMEVEMGKLAQSNGGSADVKEYGRMLETDHAAANSELQSIAGAENITLPATMDEEHSMHVKDMGSKKGADFDKAFIPMMVEDHQKDIAEFKEAASSNPNQKIKDFASKTLPTLQKHLDKAKMIKSKMK